MQIHLSDHTVQYINAQISAGGFRSCDEVIELALQEKRLREQQEEQLWKAQKEALTGLIGNDCAEISGAASNSRNREHDRLIYGI